MPDGSCLVWPVFYNGLIPVKAGPFYVFFGKQIQKTSTIILVKFHYWDLHPSLCRIVHNPSKAVILAHWTTVTLNDTFLIVEVVLH